MRHRPQALPEPTETGSLGVFHLKRMLAAQLTDRPPPRDHEWPIDQIVLSGLNLAFEETFTFVAGARPTLPAFEAWVLEHNDGAIDRGRVARLNAAVAHAFGLEPAGPAPSQELGDARVLSAADHAHFAEQGYVVVRAAVPRVQAAAAAKALAGHCGIDLDDPSTWYTRARRTQGIMVQLFHHPAQAEIRASARIRAAFAELYGSTDLWMTIDRISFNPPLREGWSFPGPHLHWDADFSVRPMPLATQGILYLTDTPAHQGAFAAVPGFHRRIDAWVAQRTSDGYPQGHELGAIASTPIPGEAGDLVIWHQGLPHAATPNVGTRPRIVQYVNMLPSPAPLSARVGRTSE